MQMEAFAPSWTEPNSPAPQAQAFSRWVQAERMIADQAIGADSAKHKQSLVSMHQQAPMQFMVVQFPMSELPWCQQYNASHSENAE